MLGSNADVVCLLCLSHMQDEALNKLTRSLQDIGLDQLGIDRVFGYDLIKDKGWGVGEDGGSAPSV